MTTFPSKLKALTNEVPWVFSKTYVQTWPHEYIVRDKMEKSLFTELVKHISEYGYQGKFYQKDITYFDDADMVYWTMGAPIEEATIINRCKKENSYEYRLKYNNLPGERS